MSLSTTSSRLIRTGSCVPRHAYGRFEFLVCDWSLMKKEPGEQVVSPCFEMADKSKWILHIFIGGKTQRQAGYITTEVTLTDLGDTGREDITATIKLSVLSQKITTAQDPDVESTSFKSIAGSNFTLDDPASKTWAVDNFMQTAALERQYLLNDAVLFSIDIEVLGKPVPLNGTMSAYVGSAVTIQEDLASLLYSADEISGDIILVTPDEKRFPCHKCILAARSQAFKRKFLNPTFTPKLLINRGQYFIRNVSSATFKDVLHFIYTDECSDDVLAMSSCSLLVVACKFEIPRLITICENYIGETLTPDRVAAMLNLAVEIKSIRLESCCSDFIAGHINNVLATKTLINLKPQALKNLITRSAIPTPLLLNSSNHDYNSDFEHISGSFVPHAQRKVQDNEEIGHQIETSVNAQKSIVNADKNLLAPSDSVEEVGISEEKMDAAEFHYSGDSSLTPQKQRGLAGILPESPAVSKDMKKVPSEEMMDSASIQTKECVGPVPL